MAEATTKFKFTVHDVQDKLNDYFSLCLEYSVRPCPIELMVKWAEEERKYIEMMKTKTPMTIIQWQGVAKYE